jgi:hypothetical protein
MNPALRTRSDYHTFYTSYAAPVSLRGNWIKPLLWLTIGFMIGMVCSRIYTPPTNAQMLAQNTAMPALTNVKA